MLMNKRKYPSVLGVAGKVADLEKKLSLPLSLKKTLTSTRYTLFISGTRLYGTLKARSRARLRQGHFHDERIEIQFCLSRRVISSFLGQFNNNTSFDLIVFSFNVRKNESGCFLTELACREVIPISANMTPGIFTVFISLRVFI